MLDSEIKLLILSGMLIVCLFLEKLRPLRRSTQPKMRRVVTNLAIASVSAIALRLIFFPIVLAVSQWSQKNQIGLLYQIQMPSLILSFFVITLLDYTLWIWHWLNHKIPFLWRFHNVHHVDLDLDVTTASRFHFGELIISSGFRSGQVILFGIDPLTLVTYEIVTTLAAQFHHSNIRLPLSVEKVLNKIVVTPRMHGIHHSIVREETDSNYSTIFSFWDRLHRTLRLNVHQIDITIGVAAYRDPQEVGLFNSLAMPFQKQKPWRLPSGEVPHRSITSTNHSDLIS